MGNDLSLNWQKWKEFAKGKRIVKIVLDEYVIFENTKDYKNHRDFIADVFRARGLEVTRWHHEYLGDNSVSKWGLVYSRADSDTRTIVEVFGIVGENLRERNSDDQTNPKKIISGVI